MKKLSEFPAKSGISMTFDLKNDVINEKEMLKQQRHEIAHRAVLQAIIWAIWRCKEVIQQAWINRSLLENFY